ncbi:MAG: RpiB/LacA/LacB family sugar-phosphate isomerase, partial [Chloroflexi bacterium]|nr:RpiB/LacA/LacB family sugar-phosphate isomerase [Chloroflexota bacterium]
MKIAIGCDHKAVDLKEIVKKVLADMGMEVVDLGTQGPERVDYPDYGRAVAEMVAAGGADRGIAI